MIMAEEKMAPAVPRHSSAQRAELEPINRRGEDWATAWQRGAPSRRNIVWRRARRYE